MGFSVKLCIVNLTVFSTFILLFGNLGNIFTGQEAMILLFTSNFLYVKFHSA